MGRAGVTLLDVEKAALQLQGRGKNPTVDAIRELLGTGSKSTITQHLKTWKSKSTEGQGKLPPELLALVAGLWERLNMQAEQRIIEIENSSEQRIQELIQALQETQREHATLKNQFCQLEEHLSVEQHCKMEYEKQLLAEKQNHDKLSERHQLVCQQIDNHKAENTRLHQLAANIQANLEHYQHAMQEARLEQNLVMEKQQNQFHQEMTELKQKLSSQHKQCVELQQHLKQKDIEIQQSQSQCHSLQANHDKLAQLVQETAHELIIFKERCEQSQQQLQTYQNELHNKNQQVIEFEKQAAVLTDYRDRLQKELSLAEDKIEFLRQEKLFLSQEKIQLETSLKHIEKLKSTG